MLKPRITGASNMSIAISASLGCSILEKRTLEGRKGFGSYGSFGRHKLPPRSAEAQDKNVILALFANLVSFVLFG